MTELSENQKQKKYFKAVFGDENPKNNKKKIEAALHRAHEVRQFEIRLYWQRSLFSGALFLLYLEHFLSFGIWKTMDF